MEEAEDATDADADVVALVVSIAFATSVSDEVEVVDVGKATASSHTQWGVWSFND